MSGAALAEKQCARARGENRACTEGMNTLGVVQRMELLSPPVSHTCRGFDNRKRCVSRICKLLVHACDRAYRNSTPCPCALKSGPPTRADAMI